MGKIPQMIYIDDNIYIDIYHYQKENKLKNTSQAINSIIPEWKRFKTIAINLQKRIEVEYQKQNEKKEKKTLGIGTIAKDNKKK